MRDHASSTRTERYEVDDHVEISSPTSNERIDLDQAIPSQMPIPLQGLCPKRSIWFLHDEAQKDVSSYIALQHYFAIASLIQISIRPRYVTTLLVSFPTLLPTTVSYSPYLLMFSLLFCCSNLLSSCKEQNVFNSHLENAVITFTMKSCCGTFCYKCLSTGCNRSTIAAI